MANFGRHLKEDITYWAVQSTDQFDRPVFAAPTVIKGRWEDRTEEIRNAAGNEIVSNSRVFLASPVVFGGYLAFGNRTDTNPTAVVDAYKIQMTGRKPDLRSMSELNIAYL